MALVVGLFAGCGGGKDKQASDDSKKTESETPADTSKKDTESKQQEEQSADGKITDKPVTLTY